MEENYKRLLKIDEIYLGFDLRGVYEASVIPREKFHSLGFAEARPLVVGISGPLLPPFRPMLLKEI